MCCRNCLQHADSNWEHHYNFASSCIFEEIEFWNRCKSLTTHKVTYTVTHNRGCSKTSIYVRCISNRYWNDKQFSGLNALGNYISRTVIPKSPKLFGFFPSEYYFSPGLVTIKIFFIDVSEVNRHLTYYLHMLLIKSSNLLKDHLTVLKFESGLTYHFP